MNASTATADTPLRQAGCAFHARAGRLAPSDLDVLIQVHLGLSGLRVPVSPGVSSVSSRTVTNNVGLRCEGANLLPSQSGRRVSARSGDCRREIC